jgi:hypothetical protein
LLACLPKKTDLLALLCECHNKLVELFCASSQSIEYIYDLIKQSNCSLTQDIVDPPAKQSTPGANPTTSEFTTTTPAM